MYIAANTN